MWRWRRTKDSDAYKGLSKEYIIRIWSAFTVHDLVCDHGYVPLVVNTSRSFPHSRLITGFVTRLTRRVRLVKQELPTLPEHLISPPVFNGVRVTQSLVLCVCFVERCLSFCIFFFFLGNVLSVLRYTNSDYSFSIFKLFLHARVEKWYSVFSNLVN